MKKSCGLSKMDDLYENGICDNNNRLGDSNIKVKGQDVDARGMRVITAHQCLKLELAKV